MHATPAQKLPHILLVDDDAATVRALTLALQSLGRLHHAQGGQEALRVARREAIDLILLDAELPPVKGIPLYATLKTDPELAHIPIILVTDQAEHDIELPGLALGVADFIAKPIRPKVVAARVITQIRLKQATDALRELALNDSLTGLPNRRAFESLLAREWGRSLRQSEPLSMLLVGIDRYKAYIAEHGRRRGEECLRDLSELMTVCVKRATDLVSRFDEDLFAVLLPGTDRAGAAEVAQRILRQAASVSSPQAALFEHAVNISVGFSSFDETCDNWVSDGFSTRQSAPISVRSADMVEAALLALDQARASGPGDETFVSVYQALAERMAAEPVH